MKIITMKSGMFALVMALLISGCTTGVQPDSEAGVDAGAGAESGESGTGATVGTIGEGGLALNSDASMRLEGHTDERGTREYNIALADRRAQSIKKLLLFQGASSSQITIISYGEEKPAALGHDEGAWKLNRRAELVYE